MLLILMICVSDLVEASTISSNKQGWDYDEIGEGKYGTPSWKIEFSTVVRLCQIAKRD
jgi:hypothetical protein